MSVAGNNIDRLVSDLTLDERQNLLDKLKAQTDISATPLYESSGKDEPEDDAETSFRRLPWYYHLYYFILSLIKSRIPIKLFEDSQVTRIGREIDALAPGLYDYHENALLSEFCSNITDLKESARFFYSALDASVNHDKGGFYAFLGSLEMGEVHRILQDETNPETLAERLPELPVAELKHRIYRTMDEAFAKVTDEQRGAMYFNARSLNCLKELSSFVFDRVIMAFGLGGVGQSCPVNAVKDMLRNLNNILFSLKVPPALPLFQSLFVYKLQERAKDDGFNITKEMQTLLGRAEIALETIREFNKKVPLTLILRCAFRNMSLCPQQISGGEDWFVVYRDYWKRRIDAKYSEYVQTRKQNELSNTFRFFLKGQDLKKMENVFSESMPDGIPVNESFTLSFLLTFYTAVFITDININLRPVLIDGEFFKRENRTEFTESYNDLMKIEDDILRFDQDISPAGDMGKRYALARQDMSSIPVKRRKIQMVLEDAIRTATGIIERSREAMKSMINILNGILKKEVGGKYDSLANFTALCGKTTVFVDGINDTIHQFQTALHLLDDIGTIDSQR